MDTHNKQFTVAPVSIEDPNQAVAYTMAQYYSVMSDPNTFHIMYNDEPPGTKEAEKLDEKAVEYGHTKGIGSLGNDAEQALIMKRNFVGEADTFGDRGDLFVQSRLETEAKKRAWARPPRPWSFDGHWPR